MEVILYQVLKAESSEQLCAENYESSNDRKDYRNDSRSRSLTTRTGKSNWIFLDIVISLSKPSCSKLISETNRLSFQQ